MRSALKVAMAVVLGFVTIATALSAELRVSDATASRPRIWLAPTRLSELRAKAAAGNPDWLHLKSSADELLHEPMPGFEVVAATNANPVQFALARPVPWVGSVPVFAAGGTGNWAAVNSLGDRPRSLAATQTGRNTFTVPIDSTAFGPFTGQRLVLFFPEGGYSAYGYQGSGWHDTLQTLGLAYQVTRRREYAVKGIELLNYISSLGAAGMVAPESIDSGFPSRSAVVGVALAYDWLFDQLTDNEKAAAVRTLNLWYDWFKRAAFENSGPAYGNYFGGHLLGFGLAGYATAPENPRSAEIIAHIRGLFDANVPAAFANGGFAGGYPPEAYVYGTNHFQRLLYYMLAVKTATGEDLFAGRDYGRKIARSLLYNLKPNRWQTSDEGDFAGEFTGVLQPGLPVVLSHVLSGTVEGSWMQFLTQNLGAAPPGGRQNDAFARFLFHDRTRAAVDYRLTLPIWYCSPGDGHTYWRSSWRDDAVWASFMGGAKRWAEHQMRSAGHISIQRGSDYLLVNSGQWKGVDGVTGSPQVSDGRSWRANTLFVDDGGDYLYSGDNYLGGQGFWGANAVLAADGGADFVYTKADLTSAYGVGDRKPYDARSVRSFHRAFVALGGGIVVVFDRARFLKDTYTAKLLFHVSGAGGAPAISEDGASTRVGKSVLFLKSLLPRAPKLEAAADPAGVDVVRPATYRIEVSNRSPGSALDGLHVFIAAAAPVRAMPAVDRVDAADGHAVGAIVSDGGVSRVVLFAAEGTPQQSVRYAIRSPSTRPVEHVVTDLVRGAAYEVVRDGVPLTIVSASSGGVVSFRSDGGGLFALTRVASGSSGIAFSGQ